MGNQRIAATTPLGASKGQTTHWIRKSSSCFSNSPTPGYNLADAFDKRDARTTAWLSVLMNGGAKPA
jgi:hypothetical protein